MKKSITTAPSAAARFRSSIERFTLTAFCRTVVSVARRLVRSPTLWPSKYANLLLEQRPVRGLPQARDDSLARHREEDEARRPRDRRDDAEHQDEHRGAVDRPPRFRALRERPVDEQANRLREEQVRAARQREAEETRGERAPLGLREREHANEQLSRSRRGHARRVLGEGLGKSTSRHGSEHRAVRRARPVKKRQNTPATAKEPTPTDARTCTRWIVSKSASPAAASADADTMTTLHASRSAVA